MKEVKIVFEQEVSLTADGSHHRQVYRLLEEEVGGVKAGKDDKTVKTLELDLSKLKYDV